MNVTKYKIELNGDRLNSLVKENTKRYECGTNKIDSVEKVVALLNDVFRMDRAAEEYLYMLAFDAKFHLLGVFEVSHGLANASLISPREIYVRALLCGAAQIMLAHNHPSGDPTPSVEDVNVTRRVQEAGNIIGVQLTDHVIIGDNTYCSLREEGIIKN